jgi:septal ring factor EnvC (AmiA/AmiB activator)
MVQKGHKEAVYEAIESEEEVHERYVKELEEAQKDLEELMERIARKKDKGREGDETIDRGFASRRGSLKAPVRGRVLKNFGKYKDPKFYTYSFHKGIDIGAAPGANVRAVYDGKVVYSGWFKGFGKILIVDHGGGYHTLSAQAEELSKNVGDEIKEGERIGRVSEPLKTSKSRKPMLYFEVRHQGQSVDPLDWLAKSELIP